jgi:uncharacterized protein YecE (DUF72 family)
MAIYIGTSGWSYNHWVGLLYPKKATSRERLAYYVERYNTVEVNNTYYRWPRDEVFQGWADQVPEGFRMTIKASRALSHSKRLRDPEVWTQRMVQGIQSLGEKRGVLLVQLPPNFACDLDRLRLFLQQFPTGVEIAIEFRHPSWHSDEVFALLETYGAAYCIMSGAGLPCVLKVTAPFVYVRLHGPDEHHLYAGSYPDDDMRWWADRILEWHGAGKTVWAYFNNDPYGHALRNADTLKQFVAERS